ncbi:MULTISPECIES: DUF3306 domain-containing protein [unclassified Halomonas]|uniref:DUF3306 domain-containing protein n=1 Tax=unclassified Halomonas TaxID=2609666 RepID=UPI002887E50F|nr:MULTISPECIES: DUF3306 domain-containing protein [unclassified Halomonas]MDT0499857.1 DUF3306 domain-containing protein [Halomonas sp. PAR7]MDT0510326.1 DUF3306 domain-containing protein [Halomonas sp. LES1]MDT0589965.1 DUF3306 domain-containing protein [Halomonas sp. PAR8]
MSRFERWSRRKLGEESEMATPLPDGAPLDEPDTHATHAPPGDNQPSDHQEGMTREAEPPTPGSLDHTLPDPDTLPAEADFSAYLQQGISRQLRRRALRRLWSAGNYGVRDGLDDYDENYNEVLKPLARDMAEQLRRWTRPSEEALEETPQEAQHAADDVDCDTQASRPVEPPYTAQRDDDAEDLSHHKESAQSPLDEETTDGDNKLI